MLRMSGTIPPLPQYAFVMWTGTPSLWLQLPIAFYITFKHGGTTDKHSFPHLMRRMRQKLCVRFVAWRTAFSSKFRRDSTNRLFATEVGKQWKQRQHIPSLLSVTVCHNYVKAHANCPSTVSWHVQVTSTCNVTSLMAHARDTARLLSHFLEQLPLHITFKSGCYHIAVEDSQPTDPHNED